jgi:serine protease Do
VELIVQRDGKELTLSAVLDNRAHLFHEDDRAEFQNNLGSQLSERRAGFPSVIQHDSILKPSECGGPLVDLDGKAVGINIARAGRVESFALPGSVVREAVKKILETQHQTAAGVER